MKTCPFCAEEIQDEAKVCRYCGKEISGKRSGWHFGTLTGFVLGPIIVVLIVETLGGDVIRYVALGDGFAILVLLFEIFVGVVVGSLAGFILGKLLS